MPVITLNMNLVTLLKGNYLTLKLSPARNDSVTTRPFTGPSLIMSAVTTPVYQSVHPRGQGHSIGEGWERVASSLERCMDKLTEANLEQSTVSKQLFVSGHLSKLSISVFNGDPMQYPVWKSAFNALVDSRPLELDMKLNLLNQHVAGKPKQVVEHNLLIGTEDAYQKARPVLQGRYGNCNVVGTDFINQLEKWPKIIAKDASGLRKISDLWDKVLAARTFHLRLSKGKREAVTQTTLLSGCQVENCN